MVSLAELRRIEPDGEPTVSLADCYDMHEVLIRKAENDHRMWEKVKAASKV